MQLKKAQNVSRAFNHRLFAIHTRKKYQFLDCPTLILFIPEVTWQEKLAKYIEITRTLVDSMLVSATAKLHSFSGGYREVAKLLDKDKELVKQRYPDGLAILTEEYQARTPRAPMYRPSSQEGLAQVGHPPENELFLVFRTRNSSCCLCLD